MEIIVEFESGRKAIYTYNIFELLVSDENVIRITDRKTGKCLHKK